MTGRQTTDTEINNLIGFEGTDRRNKHLKFKEKEQIWGHFEIILHIIRKHHEIDKNENSAHKTWRYCAAAMYMFDM